MGGCGHGGAQGVGELRVSVRRGWRTHGVGTRSAPKRSCKAGLSTAGNRSRGLRGWSVLRGSPVVQEHQLWDKVRD